MEIFIQTLKLYFSRSSKIQMRYNFGPLWNISENKPPDRFVE